MDPNTLLTDGLPCGDFFAPPAFTLSRGTIEGIEWRDARTLVVRTSGPAPTSDDAKWMRQSLRGWIGVVLQTTPAPPQ